MDTTHNTDSVALTEIEFAEALADLDATAELAADLYNEALAAEAAGDRDAFDAAADALAALGGF